MIAARDDIRVGVNDSVWLEKRRDGKVIGRTSSARPPLVSGSAEIGKDGSVRIVVSGPVRRGERGNVDVGRILIDRLNRDGARWGEPRCVDRTAREEGGVDCEAEDDQGNHLQIQVTRADTDKAFFGRQAKEGQADKLYANLDILTDTWREPIKDKAKLASRGNIVLALDAAEVSSTLPDVVGLFRRRHGIWAMQQGFKEIWIVGASWDWTYRLDGMECEPDAEVG